LEPKFVGKNPYSMKSWLFWLCLLTTSLIFAQPADVQLRVSTLTWVEGGINGPCWEGGSEEYSANVWVSETDNLEATNPYFFSCDANGLCTINPDRILVDVKHTSLRRFYIGFEAWEDDAGDRFSRDHDQLNGDDCGCDLVTLGTIDFREDPPGQWNSYGPFQCSGNHRMYIEVFYDFPLDYLLTAFDGHAQTHQAVLHWETLPGFTAKWFIVERSLDDRMTWDEIGWVAAQQLDGMYRFTDHFPQEEAHYRIKAFLPNDHLSITKAIFITQPQAKPSIVSRIFPNPTSGLLHIAFGGPLEQPFQVLLTDARGAILFERTVQPFQLPENVLTLDLSPQPQGMYFIRISDGGQQIVEQIVRS
jgi:hypothetical protein